MAQEGQLDPAAGCTPPRSTHTALDGARDGPALHFFRRLHTGISAPSGASCAAGLESHRPGRVCMIRLANGYQLFRCSLLSCFKTAPRYHLRFCIVWSQAQEERYGYAGETSRSTCSTLLRSSPTSLCADVSGKPFDPVPNKNESEFSSQRLALPCDSSKSFCSS